MTADTPHDLGLTEVVLRPVRGHHAFEACVEQLGTLIRLGVYPLGTTLPSERVLADRLHVSRATLREAMAALREAGLVETRRGRGGGTVVTMRPRTPSARRAARITPAQRADWADALEFRGLVEPGAAHLAAQRELSASERHQLEAAHEAVATASTRATHRQADSRFHLTIAALTRSPRTIDAVTSVQASLHEMLSAIPVLETNISHSDRQHLAVLKAILAGRAERARAAMEEHCDDTAALLRGLLG
ncbi:FadR/GntR family transcriptional regulator [Nocardioides sp.]|uniref:FadR/GntR family transcriptional regulator n=1 Tax=Nocardioides sp. TaxID=35761 RepID=UPI0035272433